MKLYNPNSNSNTSMYYVVFVLNDKSAIFDWKRRDFFTSDQLQDDGFVTDAYIFHSSKILRVSPLIKIK